MDVVRSLNCKVNDFLGENLSHPLAHTCLRGMVRRGIFPLNKTGWAPPTLLEDRDALNKVLGTKTIKLLTLDGVNLDAVWAPPKEKNAGTAVVFHGNGGTLDHMVLYGLWYRNRGMGLLMPTIRGYRGSEGDSIESGEIGSYLDAESAVRHVIKDNGIDKEKVILHGLSLGGVFAASGAANWGIRCTLDHPFASPERAIKHVMKHIRWRKTCPESKELTGAKKVIVEKGMRLIRVTPSFIGTALGRLGFKTRRVVEIPKDKQMGACTFLKEDGFNNCVKSQAFTKPCFVLVGCRDEIVASEDGEDICRPHRGIEEEHADSMSHLITLSGDHVEPFFSTKKVVDQYCKFLIQEGLVDESYFGKYENWCEKIWKDLSGSPEADSHEVQGSSTPKPEN